MPVTVPSNDVCASSHSPTVGEGNQNKNKWIDRGNYSERNRDGFRQKSRLVDEIRPPPGEMRGERIKNPGFFFEERVKKAGDMARPLLTASNGRVKMGEGGQGLGIKVAVEGRGVSWLDSGPPSKG